jgi:5'-nucleotidase
MRREAPGAAVWLLNAGSIRLDDVVPAGPLTEYDVIRILPFGGPVVRAELRGALLRRVLDQGARNAGTGGYLASNAERGPGGAWTVGGRPVADTAWYPAVLTDYLLTGQEAGLGFLTRESPDVRGAAPGRDVRRGFIDELRARHGRAAGAAGAAR